mmetsp:Transcript_89026/g.252319  ORF Transcript_89026/g.252319 Transcript_89026/m.252319 type:complete len:328 (+) Transcript_89026:879-1862(+)
MAVGQQARLMWRDALRLPFDELAHPARGPTPRLHERGGRRRPLPLRTRVPDIAAHTMGLGPRTAVAHDFCAHPHHGRAPDLHRAHRPPLRAARRHHRHQALLPVPEPGGPGREVQEHHLWGVDAVHRRHGHQHLHAWRHGGPAPDLHRLRHRLVLVHTHDAGCPPAGRLHGRRRQRRPKLGQAPGRHVRELPARERLLAVLHGRPERAEPAPRGSRRQLLTLRGPVPRVQEDLRKAWRGAEGGQEHPGVLPRLPGVDPGACPKGRRGPAVPRRCGKGHQRVSTSFQCRMPPPAFAPGLRVSVSDDALRTGSATSDACKRVMSSVGLS